MLSGGSTDILFSLVVVDVNWSRPWLEPGREEARGDDGVPSLLDCTSLDRPRLWNEVGRPPATESPRFKPVFALTLHLLLTLSDLRIMALSTKPPKPFVGETGRFEESTLDVLPRLGVEASLISCSRLEGRLLFNSC